MKFMIFWEYFIDNPTLIMNISIIYIFVIIVISIVVLFFIDDKGKEDIHGERREDEAGTRES